MAGECPVEAAMRERVAVVERLPLTVTRSVEKLAVTVETLSERVNQERGQNSVTSRLEISRRSLVARAWPERLLRC